MFSPRNSKLANYVLYLFPLRKEGNKILAFCEDENLLFLYQHHKTNINNLAKPSATHDNEEKINQENKQIGLLFLENGLIPRGSGVSIPQLIRDREVVVDFLVDLFATLESQELIRFLKSNIALMPTNTPITFVASRDKKTMINMPQHINSTINGIIQHAIENRVSLEDTVKKVQGDIGKILKINRNLFMFSVDHQHWHSAAKKITEQAYYRALLDKKIRRHIPKDATIYSNGIIKAHRTVARIEQINQFLLDSHQGMSSEKVRSQLANLLGNIGIRLDSSALKEVLSHEEKVQSVTMHDKTLKRPR